MKTDSIIELSYEMGFNIVEFLEMPPNEGDLLSQQFINRTRYGSNRKLRLIISLSYKADHKKAREIIQSIIDK